jgi:DNA-binding MarR family transcriptional regulator
MCAMSPVRIPSAPLGKFDFETLSAFRFQLTSFLRFSERAAKRAGLAPLQYLLLLHLRGYPGRDWATVGELAGRLQASAHGTAALVSRCESQGLVARKRSKLDLRCVEIRLTRKAVALLNRVAALHREELRALATAIPVATAD